MNAIAERIALEDLTPELVAAFGMDDCLIWSGEHAAWWKMGRSGYTTERSMAGRYTLKGAYDHAGHCGPEKQIAFVRLTDEDRPTLSTDARTSTRSAEVEVIAPEGCVGTMDAERAIYFLKRFKRDEKMLGPHEQWALDFTIAALRSISSPDPRAFITNLVDAAEAIAFQAGVGGRETAGAIVSYLATSPDEIEPFFAGKLSPIDFAGDWTRGGRLSWHGADGKVWTPEAAAAARAARDAALEPMSPAAEAQLA